MTEKKIRKYGQCVRYTHATHPRIHSPGSRRSQMTCQARTADLASMRPQNEFQSREERSPRQFKQQCEDGKERLRMRCFYSTRSVCARCVLINFRTFPVGLVYSYVPYLFFSEQGLNSNLGIRVFCLCCRIHKALLWDTLHSLHDPRAPPPSVPPLSLLLLMLPLTSFCSFVRCVAERDSTSSRYTLRERSTTKAPNLASSSSLDSSR